MLEAQWVKEAVRLIEKVASHVTMRDEIHEANDEIEAAIAAGKFDELFFNRPKPTKEEIKADVAQVVDRQRTANETIPLFWIRLADLVRTDKPWNLPLSQELHKLLLDVFSQEESIVIRYLRDTMCHHAPYPEIEALTRKLYTEDYSAEIGHIVRHHLSGVYRGDENDMAVAFAKRALQAMKAHPWATSLHASR